MTVRDHLGRSLAVGGALAVLGAGALTLSERALAVAPPATAGANGATLVASSAGAENNKPIGPLAGTVTTSSITVPESAQTYLRDLDVRTFIEHSASGDLDIEITSPARPGQTARTVKLVLRPNGIAGVDNVFKGTLWDDSSLNPVSDLSAALLGADSPQADLTPEGALGRFVGIDPRGTWTLKVTDQVDAPGDPATDGGTLTGWSLELATQDVAPVVAPTVTAQTPAGPAVAIPDSPAAGITSSITVAGAKNYLTDVNLVTNISHADSGDLEIRLSHGGRTALIASKVNGGTVFYTDRTFDDSASTLVRQATDAPGSVVPEGALSAFRGMDPNGVWTLTVSDVVPLTTGTLNSWKLNIGAADSSAPPPVVPPVTPPVVTPPVSQPPVVIPQGATPLKLSVRKLVVKKFRAKSRIQLRITWRNGTGRVTYRAILSTKIGKKNVRKIVKGAGKAGNRTVKKTVRVPKKWRGKKVTVRLIVKNSGKTIVRNKKIRRF